MDKLETVIITGISGAGKTTALHAVEDLGFYCVDNLPLPLLGDFIDTMKAEPSVSRAALVVDVRLRKYIDSFATACVALAKRGEILETIYLDAADDVLVRRFSQTRRRHPLGGDDLEAGLAAERKLLAQLRAQASTCIDTTELTPHELKRTVQDRYRMEGPDLVLSIVSFGFRYGVPSHADLVFDARFLPNPYFDDLMRAQTGRDRSVMDFVLSTADAREFVDRIASMLQFLLPRYEGEGKVYLTVAVGCTGGRHRSVAIAEELGKRLGSGRRVNVRHRDIER